MARDLYKGLTGDDVTWIQQALSSLGYYTDVIDGIFGNNTEIAVKNFQIAYGLYVDGIVGSQTYATLTAITSTDTSDAISGGVNPMNSDSSLRESGRWGNHRFVVSAELIRSFNGLQITSSSEMQSSENSAQGYVSYKGSSPSEVSFTLELNASTGCDVRNEAITWANEAQNGIRDYFYVGGTKLLDTLLLLTDVTVSEITLSPVGTWISANVSITLKQCEATDTYIESSSSSGASGSSGSSGYSGSGSSAYNNASTGSRKTTTQQINEATGSNYSGFILKTGTTKAKAATVKSTVAKAGAYLAQTITAANNARVNKTTTTTVSRLSTLSRLKTGTTK